MAKDGLSTGFGGWPMSRDALSILLPYLSALSLFRLAFVNSELFDAIQQIIAAMPLPSERLNLLAQLEDGRIIYTDEEQEKFVLYDLRWRRAKVFEREDPSKKLVRLHPLKGISQHIVACVCSDASIASLNIKTGQEEGWVYKKEGMLGVLALSNGCLLRYYIDLFLNVPVIEVWKGSGKKPEITTSVGGREDDSFVLEDNRHRVWFSCGQALAILLLQKKEIIRHNWQNVDIQNIRKVNSPLKISATYLLPGAKMVFVGDRSQPKGAYYPEIHSLAFTENDLKCDYLQQSTSSKAPLPSSPRHTLQYSNKQIINVYDSGFFVWQQKRAGWSGKYYTLSYKNQAFYLCQKRTSEDSSCVITGATLFRKECVVEATLSGEKPDRFIGMVDFKQAAQTFFKQKKAEKKDDQTYFVSCQGINQLFFYRKPKKPCNQFPTDLEKKAFPPYPGLGSVLLGTKS
jgi:hypothetical protein